MTGLRVGCFVAVTKPASICNHKKFRIRENVSLQITCWSVDFTLLFEYPYFFSGDKIRRRIRISAAAWSGSSSFSLSAARRSGSFPAGTQTLSKRLYNVYDCV